MITASCPFCDVTLDGDDLDSFGRAGLAHVRAEHGDMPYPDMAVRNFFEGMIRQTGSTERLDEIGSVEIHPMTEDRIDDWLQFFDTEALPDIPQYSSCYCLEPHELDPSDDPADTEHWTVRRNKMIDRLRSGTTQGYLAYVDGRPAAWVNASRRCDYSLHRQGDGTDEQVIGVACVTVAPPYRGHRVAEQLVDRVVADAADRGASAVEAYPLTGDDAPEISFRGARSTYDKAGFSEVAIRTRDTVMRRDVS